MHITPILLAAAGFTLTRADVTPGTLSQVTDFGSNPSNVSFNIYVPKNLATSPGIIVALHYCTGTGEEYYRNTPYAQLGEQYGFISIFPTSPYDGTCWDVSSEAALTHDGGGDSNSIANMVTWTIKQYNADSSKVFVTGSSSGAMMTNVMAATYPDLFAAGTVYSGVAAGCFVSSTDQVDGWNSSCAQGQVVATPQVWASIAEDMYPGYNGTRPKMQIYHGSIDTTLYPENFNETCKQWAGVFGYDYASPQTVENNSPQVNYTTTIWGDDLQGIFATGVGHTVPINATQDMACEGGINIMAIRPVSTEHSGTNDPNTAPRLQYPTFPSIGQSVEELLSQSRLAMSRRDAHPARPPSSLSDSWATLSTPDTTSEDDARSEQTDVASLIGQSGPDDVASLDGTASTYDDEEERDVEEEEEDDYEDKESVMSDPPRPFFSHDDSTVDVTPKASLLQTSESIEFIEPEQWPEMERVELKHTVHILDKEEASAIKTNIPKSLHYSDLAITLQQTMTKEGLSLDKPFRVLYVGNPDFRHIILDKIGDVLVSSSTGSLTSSTESSRYHVVPTSFGVGATPNYAELLPIHVQLIVDECVEASAVKPNNITLKFKNRPSCTSSWTGTEHQIESETDWSLPDLSVFFVSDHDSDAAIRTWTLAHKFMKTHGIPVMVISEEPLWKKPGQQLFTLDYHSLHMRLESRRPLTGDTVLLRRYPIDLKTFESITPSQLNRHLASLSALYPKPTMIPVSPSPVAPETTKVFYDSEKYPTLNIFSPYGGRAQDVALYLRLAVSIIGILLTVWLGYGLSLLCVQYLPGSAISNNSNLTPTTTMTAEIISSTSFAGTTSVALKTPHRIDSLSISIAKDLTEMSSLLSDSKSTADEFQFQVVGDCHVIIKLPPGTKQSKFDAMVERDGESLPFELSKIFDGVYTLRLNREDAYGLVNLTVSMRSRRAKLQTLELDFGTPWLKMENWKRAAQAISSQVRRDIGHAQTGLTDIYSRFTTDVQVWVGDVVKRSHSLRQDETLRRSSARLWQSKDVIVIRSKQLGNIIARNALQQLATASVAVDKLQQQSRLLTTEVQEMYKNFVLSLSPHPHDGKCLKDSFRDMKTTASLNRAQKLAKKLAGQHSRRARVKSHH
ncbi:hypothetical protein PISL3812_07726 [Talaromyces islandicus]|uniref:Carboxylic ester hydrolase n=1 Tax=Talaromyces islandicus TaxID=28573 RepID=A0A0U1M6J8_TALIS|nr:hypothetical protein PISL3812_07726 [Talaromyces islandicus]